MNPTQLHRCYCVATAWLLITLPVAAQVVTPTDGFHISDEPPQGMVYEVSQPPESNDSADQPATPRQTPPPDRTTRPNPFASVDPQSRQRRSRSRLARAPYMLGDFLGLASVSADVLYMTQGQYQTHDRIDASLPLPGSQIVKVSENNVAMTGDRAYLLYNHFHNAINTVSSTGFSSKHIERGTFGWERSFRGGRCSVEIRLPITDNIDLAGPGFASDSGQIGNLGVIFKRLTVQTERTAVSTGIGVTAPTAGDVQTTVPALNYMFEVQNQTVHLMPFIGRLSAPDDNFFYHSFLQLDIPVGGDSVLMNNGVNTASGVLNAQTLLILDAGTGQWHYRNPRGSGITGIASLVELHYTTALENADRVAGPALLGSPVFGNRANRIDILNLTFGMHVTLGSRIALRVGGAIPLNKGDNSAFDSETQVQLIVR